jgi:hypothetical protein
MIERYAKDKAKQISEKGCRIRFCVVDYVRPGPMQ